MNRIKEIFEHASLKGRPLLSVFFTAGYPQLNSTLDVLKALEEYGANLIELGVPYSDPLADGPVIQASSTKALANGMTIKKLFEQLKDFRKDISIPVILMGNMNPVLQYGFDKFCREAAAVGIDGLILPDLPEYEFEVEYGAIIKKYQLDFIFLVTPETSDERVKKLDELSSGFLYAVSSSSTTGKDKSMEGVKPFLQRLKRLSLKNPVVVGFGIKDKQGFQTACENADGAIVGSAYVKAIETARDVKAATKSFLSSILS